MNANSTQTVNKRRKIISGVVVSNKMDKTVVIQVTSLAKHPKYGKYYRRYKKYKAHDENNTCEVGDLIEIIESRPISKQKRFRLYRVLQKVERVDADLKDELVEAGA